MVREAELLLSREWLRHSIDLAGIRDGLCQTSSFSKLNIRVFEDSQLSALNSTWRVPRLRRDGLEELGAAVFHGEHDSGFGTVALFVDGGLAGDAGEIFRRGDGVAQGGPCGGAGLRHRGGDEVDGVVAEGGDGFGNFLGPAGGEFFTKARTSGASFSAEK